jgi:uncharacterized protein YkwD
MSHRIAFILCCVGLAALALAPAAGAREISRLVAPRTACAHQSSIEESIAVQEEAMRCMVNYARRHAGEAEFSESDSLDRSAADKSHDILRCDSFSHEACGRQYTYWMQRVGYLASGCWRAGENIAWGAGDYGTVRAIFEGWIHSPGHRENILGHYRQLGVGLRIGRLDGRSGVHVWTQHFGSHC